MGIKILGIQRATRGEWQKLKPKIGKEVGVIMREHKKEAQKWLESFRSGTIHYDGALWSLRRDVLGGGLTLEDIGTSEKELEELRVKGCKTSAQEWLESLRSGTIHYDGALWSLRRGVL